MLVASTISQSLDNVSCCRSKFLKPIADGLKSRNNLVCSVLCAIALHNMLILILYIERCKKTFNRDFVTNKTYLETSETDPVND